MNNDSVECLSDLWRSRESKGFEYSTLEFGLKGRLLYDKKMLRAKLNKISIESPNIVSKL
jgi:hypothetical protein